MVARAGKARVGPLRIEALLPQVQLYFVESIGKLEVWKVEGKIIRDEIFIDFTEGGNSEAYPWMGPNKIWLDHDVDDDEVGFVKLHELHEYTLMCKGWDYEEAHKDANRIELMAREDPDRLEGIWEAQKKTYLDLVERR